MGVLANADTNVTANTREGLRLVRRHMLIGWWLVLCFLLMGGLLETFHGLKLQWYLHVESTMRRLMLTLAHAHGSLLGLINIAFAATLRTLPDEGASLGRRASPWLTAASILLPGGFLVGGLVIYSGDPGFGILLVPPGAIALAVAVIMTTREVGSIGRK